MGSVVISGSAKDQSALTRWSSYWSTRGHSIHSPVAIDPARFTVDYPVAFEEFFEHLCMCDLLFVMNEDRGDIIGYVGAATFAELAFVVARNALRQSAVEVVLLQPPSDRVNGADEIRTWDALGWIRFLKPDQSPPAP